MLEGVKTTWVRSEKLNYKSHCAKRGWTKGTCVAIRQCGAQGVRTKVSIAWWPTGGYEPNTLAEASDLCQQCGNLRPCSVAGVLGFSLMVCFTVDFSCRNWFTRLRWLALNWWLQQLRRFIEQSRPMVKFDEKSNGGTQCESIPKRQLGHMEVA